MKPISITGYREMSQNDILYNLSYQKIRFIFEFYLFVCLSFIIGRIQKLRPQGVAGNLINFFSWINLGLVKMR